MKKIIIVFLLLGFAVCASFANELDVKLGMDISNYYNEYYDRGWWTDYDHPYTEIGVTFATDYLFTFARGKIGIGIGAEYLPTRKGRFGDRFSCLPLYSTIKFKIPKINLYFKQNLGFTIPLNSDNGDDLDTGACLSEAIGYEMPMGLFFEINYGWYTYGSNNGYYHYTESYQRGSFNVGYRFVFA